MPAQIIDGNAIAEKIKDKIAAEVYRLKRRPNLAIILVGEREDSKIYVRRKEKEAKKVGIDTHLYKCPTTISSVELLAIIKFLNQDELIDAILVQLPLPKHLDTNRIIAAILPSKDVDRFHPHNLSQLTRGGLLPPVFGVIQEMLKEIKYDLEGKNVCIISNSSVFGYSLAEVLSWWGGKCSWHSPREKDLVKHTLRADLLITAVGKPHLITASAIKKGSTIIDIGITRQGNKLCGDVDFKECFTKAAFITPVPGGVGPLTVAMTFYNTLELFKKRWDLL
ncbi:bifunctional 5,10-methylenetetrahydrofolate dehydrogenase/5,10-methenyltetrahydrofolate cyclohydrolase [Candidatus Parcubacteria bacterium]|nr:MAG: bifunctional 5,10-methylenetetrahydrofolate dehydrogenase/5,10-methenyltetrahydrofolate cyclohydrolase [Candidatus Parcubacteria bacterium]